MDSKKLYAVAVQATSSLPSSDVAILDANPYSARIRVVCDLFQSLSLTERFERLYALFYAPSGPVPRSYAIEFEAWTRAEFSQLEKSRVTEGEGSGGGGEEPDRRKVTSPAAEDRRPIS